MRQRTFFGIFTALTVIATIYCLSACKSENRLKDGKDKDLFLPDVENDKIIAVISGADKYPSQDDVVRVEAELPPEEFIGTVIEEENEYIIVVPNMDEKEYAIAKKIRIDFIKTQKKDYLYGTGRKVHITYIPHMTVTDGTAYIETDAVKTEGFEDFELSVIPESNDMATYVIDNGSLNEFNPSYGLYYSGLKDVYVAVDGKTMPLATALRMGKVTLQGIISKCNTSASLGKIQKQEYKDGGSKKYIFDDFSIIKFHTIDGNRDMFIGKKDMDINVINTTSHFCVGAYLDYGLIIKSKDVTSTGATFIYEKYDGFKTGSLQFGEDYRLEVLTEKGWENVPYSKEFGTDTPVWCGLAYLVNEAPPFTEHKTDWSYLYGTLPDGKYRLVKNIMDFRKTADYDTFTAYSYFEINN